MSKISCVFKTRMVSFLDELILQFPSHSMFLFAKTILQQKDADFLIESFYEQVFPLKDLIDTRDEESLFQRGEVMAEAAFGEIIRQLGLIWRNMKSEDKEVIWDWLDSFIRMSEQFVLQNRAT